MPTGPQRFQYPKSLDEGGRGSQWEQALRLHGAGSSDALFKGATKVIAPWPTAGRTKLNPKGYDQSRVDAALRNPSLQPKEMDPTALHATQPWVTASGVSYYMGDEYRKTGRTFADQHQIGNRFPVVYTDTQGRNKLLSGHHRATAALLRGEQFRAIHIEE
jgi:hypothetical protein